YQKSFAWLIYLSQPLTNIRLPAYSPNPLSKRKLGWVKVNKVWAVPGSLATTTGIVVYFLFLRVLRCFGSPAYRYIAYEFSYTPRSITCMRFPHSDIHGSKLVWQLPAAFRSRLRPSSVSYVKASFVCA